MAGCSSSLQGPRHRGCTAWCAPHSGTDLCWANPPDFLGMWWGQQKVCCLLGSVPSPGGIQLGCGDVPPLVASFCLHTGDAGSPTCLPLLLCPCADECCRVFTAATKSREAAWCKTPVKVMISSLHEEAGWFMSRSVVFGSAVFVWSLKRAARNHRITSFTVHISSWCHGELK